MLVPVLLLELLDELPLEAVGVPVAIAPLPEVPAAGVPVAAVAPLEEEPLLEEDEDGVLTTIPLTVPTCLPL
jgi:hypothetical protein